MRTTGTFLLLGIVATACGQFRVQGNLTTNAAPGANVNDSYTYSTTTNRFLHTQNIASNSASNSTSAMGVSVGSLSASVTANAGTFVDNDFTYGANAGARAFGNFLDMITVTGTPGTDVSFRLSLAASGSMGTSGINASASVIYRLAVGTQEIEYDERINTQGVRTVFRDQRAPFIVTRRVGQRFQISNSFDIQASGAASRIGGSWVIGSAYADFGSTFITQVEVLTPGGGYTSDSGQVYAVPEPGSIAAFGAGVLLLVRRKRRTA